MLRWVEPLHEAACVAFYGYGKTRASHSARTILFSTLIVFLLTYPAYTTYLKPKSLLANSTHFWESPASVSLFAQKPAQYLLDRPFLRIEQVFITATHAYGPDSDRDAGALTRDVLIYIHWLQRRIATTSVALPSSLTANQQSSSYNPSPSRDYTLSDICFKPFNDTRCLIHSPLEYWHNDPIRLRADPAILRTLNGQRRARTSLGLGMHPDTLFGRARYDDAGRTLTGAEAVVVTYFLHDQGFADREAIGMIWDAVWDKVVDGEEVVHEFTGWKVQEREEGGTKVRAVYRKGKRESNFLIFQHNLFNPFLRPHHFLLLDYAFLFLFVSHSFGRLQLIKSKNGLGLAAVCLVIVSVSCALGVSALLGLRMHLVPWWVYPSIAAIAGLENMFILANAVVSADVDDEVNEKVARGLGSVGPTITAVLGAELIILFIGAEASIPAVREFCLFMVVALIVDYGLQMTFYITVLSIDVRRVELADLADNRVSKRLRRKQQEDSDNELEPDSLDSRHNRLHPVLMNQEVDNPEEMIYKDVKKHRIFNAPMMCTVILTLAFVYRSASPTIASVETFAQDIAPFSDSSVANSFWDTVNPSHEDQYIEQMAPKFLTVLTGSEVDVDALQQSDYHYEQQPSFLRLVNATNNAREPSRVFKALLQVISWFMRTINAIDIPIMIMVVILVGTILWTMKPLRQSILSPVGKWMYITISREVFATIAIFARARNRHARKLQEATFDKHQHHAGPNATGRAATTNPNNTPEVQVVTLRGKHAADIQRLDANPKAGTIVSCGQDGRIIMWDGLKGEWLARLDQMTPSPCRCGCNGLRMVANVNPERVRAAAVTSRGRRVGPGVHGMTLKGASSSLGRCVRTDQGNKWVACGFDDGTIRVWRVETGEMVRELCATTESFEEARTDSAEVTNYFNTRRRKHSTLHSPIRAAVAEIPQGSGSFQDRITALAFVGAVAEYCNPQVAEAAAKSAKHDHMAAPKSSQDYLISANKSGMIREWDLEAGDCVNMLKSGQSSGISALYVIEGKAAFRHKGVSWVFSSGKDGTIKCWERKMVPKDGREDIDFTNPQTTREKIHPEWRFLYTLDGHENSPITALSADVPIGGMGILITGSQDGAVKVWNFETGDAICTLSAGGAGLRKKRAEAQVREQLNSIGTNNTRTSDEPPSNHRGPIAQIVVARYCRVETGPGKCRGCDTCFGNGFLVASSSVDETARVWRLERSDGGSEGNCTLCGADYSHQHYSRRKNGASNGAVNGRKTSYELPGRNSSQDRSNLNHEVSAPPTTRRKIVPSGTLPSSISVTHKISTRPYQAAASVAAANGILPVEDLEDGMVDIEQLGGDGDIKLSPRFLGQISQPAGRGLVFCKNMVLAGVRRKTITDDPKTKKHIAKWEVWMASLTNHEAVAMVGDDDDVGDDDNDNENNDVSRHMRIPVNTVSLDEDGMSTLDGSSDGHVDERGVKGEDYGREWLLVTLGIKRTRLSSPTMPRKQSRRAISKLSVANLATMQRDLANGGSHHYSAGGNNDLEDNEAAQLLPFSAVRQIVPLGGDGFACDYGNFVKVVWIGNREAEVDYGERKVKVPSIVKARTATKENCCSEKAGGCCGGKNSTTKDGCCGSKDGKQGDCKCEKSQRQSLRPTTLMSYYGSSGAGTECETQVRVGGYNITSSIVKNWFGDIEKSI
ncbi:hypothetical protein BC937DRAFT_90082 [Endogone sp. FLAS-F59071]|nr:hypothetical protein BC937DRAFT_90082 [Endogone sp. FLAS-F59071]|eukprot:RUS17354.1 hypothetical protein BC937DRAFT_90082 [Endogone sp. FLAS-F59071]